MKAKNRPDTCKHIAYSVSPEHQPIIARGKYFCKYCGNEVEVADCMMPNNPGWFHKKNGDFITGFTPIVEVEE